MKNFLNYLWQRLLTFFVVLFVGISVLFILPRLMPSDPIDNYLQRLQGSAGQSLTGDQVTAIRKALGELYGIQGSLVDQYFGYLKRVLISHDFGPSFAAYPKPVSEFIAEALPWTFGLMLVSTVIAWVLGNLVGLIAGFYHNRKFATFLETLGILIYPIPYYIFALILIILLAFVIPAFPLTFVVMPGPATLGKIVSIVYNSFLPALTLILVNFGWNVLGMKSLAYGAKEEGYVLYARLKGVKPHRVMYDYVARNAILPQITSLALSLGSIFGGALITEMLFSYPGMGMLMRTAISNGDYNLLYGTITIMIVAVAISTLAIDMLYPLFDPRIRHR
jgi:peptide/nickel transport system permease protein